MKFLAVCTNTDQYTDATPTGLWLSELVHVYDVLTKAGAEVVIASPQGGNIPIDPRSLGAFGLDALTKSYVANEAFMDLMLNSVPLSEIDAEEYAGVFYAGGHGCMFDFVGNADIERINRTLYQQNKIISAVCHGVAALFDDKIVEGKRVTGYTWSEEILAWKHAVVPFSNKAKFTVAKAIVKNHWLPFVSHVVTDGNIITGQNPQSSKQLAQEILQALQ